MIQQFRLISQKKNENNEITISCLTVFQIKLEFTAENAGSNMILTKTRISDSLIV